MKCSRCEIDKPLNKFYKNGKRIRKDCKDCVISKTKNNYYKDIHLSRKRKRITYKNRVRYENYEKNYGISKENFKNIVKEQNGRCWICNKYYGEKLHVDHCHKTGRIRGIICWECNMGLGLFKDNTVILDMAIRYLMNSSRTVNKTT